MRNGLEMSNGNEQVEIETHRGPFSWIEMLVMTVLVVISIVMG